MDIVNRTNTVYTLNFRRGEELMASLRAFAAEHQIVAAHVTGLGAAGRLVIAYYNLETKEYEKREFVEDVEILSLVGNIGVREDGDTVVHVHGVFGRRDFSTFGGHVFELIISGAGEIHLTALDSTISRAYDAETGLALMCPASEV